MFLLSLAGISDSSNGIIWCHCFEIAWSHCAVGIGVDDKGRLVFMVLDKRWTDRKLVDNMQGVLVGSC